MKEKGEAALVTMSTLSANLVVQHMKKQWETQAKETISLLELQIPEGFERFAW